MITLFSPFCPSYICTFMHALSKIKLICGFSRLFCHISTTKMSDLFKNVMHIIIVKIEKKTLGLYYYFLVFPSISVTPIVLWSVIRCVMLIIVTMILCPWQHFHQCKKICYTVDFSLFWHGNFSIANSVNLYIQDLSIAFLSTNIIIICNCATDIEK